MSSLLTGNFYIVSAVDPKPPIGADINASSEQKPVVTDGEMKVWSIKNGQLVLNDKWYTSKLGVRVMVQPTVDPTTRWDIRRVGDSYVIKSTGVNEAWTATEPDPNFPVVLERLNDPPYPNQLWKFIPAPGY